jgi:trans-aconitate methyltransferase
VVQALEAAVKRICEPELMDEPIQARAYAMADFNRSDQAFCDRVLRLLSERPPLAPGQALRVLDLGCGPGNISFRLADALPNAVLLGLDGATAMLEEALARQRLEPRRWPQLRFAQIALPFEAGVSADPALTARPLAGALPPPQPWPAAPPAGGGQSASLMAGAAFRPGSPAAMEVEASARGLGALPADLEPPFQVLVSNSLLHHLHDPAVLWTSLRQLAAPGALVVVRDLRRPADAPALRTLVRRHGAGAPAVLRRDFAHSLRAAFRPEEVRQQLAAAGLEQLQVRPWQDRYLDIWGTMP